MIVPIGELDHEVRAGQQADPAAYDRLGYTVGRGLFDPDVVRQVRAPLFDRLVEDGHIEPVEGEEDKFAWRGDATEFDIHLGSYRAALTEACHELVVGSGMASRAIEAMWGRMPAVWTPLRVFVNVPGDPDRVHRDGWHMIGHGGPADHLNVWLPLTRVDADDAPLAIAVGTHETPDGPAEVPVVHPLHKEVLFNTGNMPPAEKLAPLWHTTTYAVGDAIAFRPDSVHSATPNTSPYFRFALSIMSQDGRTPLSPKAGLSLDPRRDLAAVEWLTLAVLAVQPSTPWTARQAFLHRGIIGQLWAEHYDELVTRAFTTLERRGFIEPHELQPDEGKGIHQYFHITPKGDSEVREWLVIRPGSTGDPRLLPVKLLFCQWLGLDETSLLTNRAETSVLAGHAGHRPS